MKVSSHHLNAGIPAISHREIDGIYTNKIWYCIYIWNDIINVCESSYFNFNIFKWNKQYINSMLIYNEKGQSEQKEVQNVKF